jgi:alpha-tubulin suppressor-like RCC1 family protein
MSVGVVRAVLASLVMSCAACSNEFQVLEQRTPDLPVPAADAGADTAAPSMPDGALPDARIARDDAAMTRDANTPADAELPPPDGSSSLNLVSGFSHTCALVDGGLWCWGNDNVGQVGVAGDRNRDEPVRVGGGDAFVDVCAGELHSCALRADGTTLCWGSNAYGQLGLGDLNSRELPTALNSRRFVALSCGGFNTCALAPRGELWCWGDNSEGKLAQDDPPAGTTGSLERSESPIPVQTELRFAKVSVGQGHVCAVSEQGRLYCWGRNNVGQVGDPTAPEQTRAPVAVGGDTQYLSASAGQRHSCAVDVAGKLSCWGQNVEGLLGLESDQPIVRAPAAVGDDSDWDQVALNWLHGCAHKKNGSLFCWGRGEEGQLGTGDSMQRNAPTRVRGDDLWSYVNAGQFHSCAVADDGLYCWGANDTGQLGFGDNARRYVPLKVRFP